LVIDRTLPDNTRRAFLKSYVKRTLGSRVKNTKSETNITETENGLVPSKTGKSDVICFPITDWGWRYQRTNHLLARFAENGHRVFILPVELRALETPYKINVLARNIFELKVSVNVRNPSNIYRNNWSKDQIESFLQSFEIARTRLRIDGLCWVVFPAWAPIVLSLIRSYCWKAIYDLIDYHLGFSNVSHLRAAEEKELFQESQLTIATSELLLTKAIQSAKGPVIRIPNACDFQLFNAVARIPPPPSDSVTIGYYGAIADWFDDGIVSYVATEEPKWRILLVGRYEESIAKRLGKFANVQMLGEKPYEDLPVFLSQLNVFIIPFKDNDLIRATDPVKFYEVMATGKPVVATAIPDLMSRDSSFCYIARNGKEFLGKIKIALEEDKKLTNARIDYARANTWDRRYSSLRTAMDQYGILGVDGYHKADALKHGKRTTEDLAWQTFN